MSEGWEPPPDVVPLPGRPEIRAILEPGQAFAGGSAPPTHPHYVIEVGENRYAGFLADFDDTAASVRTRLERWVDEHPALIAR